MFSLQAGQIQEQLAAAGYSDIGQILAPLLGQCRQALQHDGPVTFNGPVSIPGGLSVPRPSGQGGQPTAGQPGGFIVIATLLTPLPYRGQCLARSIFRGNPLPFIGWDELLKPNQQLPIGYRVGFGWTDAEKWVALMPDDCPKQVS